jgi:chromosome segregation ATPase
MIADTQPENREQLESKAENLKDQAEKIGGELSEHQENKENLMEKLERLKRRGGLYKQQQQGLEAKIKEAIKIETEAVEEGQEQLKPIQQEMQKLHKTVVTGVRKMETNLEDVQQLRQELKGDSNQVMLIPLAKEIGEALGKGLEIIGDLMRGGAASLLNSLWTKIKRIFR